MISLTIQMYHMVYQIGVILAIVFAVLSLILFFAFRIRHTVNDMTGRTKVHEKKKREQGENGKLEKASGRKRNKGKSITTSEATVLLSNHATTLLNSNATTILQPQISLQGEVFGETDMLTKADTNISNICIEIVKEITYIHASEIIVIE